MPRSAREIFVASQYKAGLEKIVQTMEFEVGCNYALLELLEEAPKTFNTQADSWQNGVYMAGAKRVLEILGNLHQSQIPPEKAKAKTLNYDRLK